MCLGVLSCETMLALVPVRYSTVISVQLGIAFQAEIKGLGVVTVAVSA